MDSLEDTQPINAMRLSTPGNIIQPLNQIKFREEILLNSSKIYRYLDTEQSFTKNYKLVSKPTFDPSVDSSSLPP